MNNLNKLIEDTQSAYKLLKQFVRDDEYFAYLNGLLDAKNALIGERGSLSKSEEQ